MLNEKNPYENENSVDIPDFPSIKAEDDDIDRSIFKMDLDDEYEEDEDEYYDEEDDEEEEPTYLNVRKSVVTVTAILLVVLLAVSVIGLAYGMSKKKAYTTLKTEYDQYVSKANGTETALNAQIAALQKQVAELEKGNVPVAEGGETYKVKVDMITVRAGASASNSYANYNNLPDNVKSVCTKNGDYVYIAGGKSFTVLETKTEELKSGKRIWGRIADNAWVCLSDNGEAYCAK
ncbi:MAG: hypothetical protein Q4B60_05750 [Erysipelotrichaceae bacterium]|nr:hypothetical protein [Erysipelotrichaceae bacterium]